MVHQDKYITDFTISTRPASKTTSRAIRQMECSSPALSTVKFPIFLLNLQIFYESWPKDK